MIKVTHVSKMFKIPHARKKTLFHNLTSIASGGYDYEKFFALNDITFHVRQGEFVGIIGRNGSGKSTLLKVLSRIYQPTEGAVIVEEEIFPMLELGVGFQLDFTVRDNIYLYGSLLGFSRKQIGGKINEILDFAELTRFADAKLEKLSTGMQMRLGFAIAMQSIAPIILVDEVLAVGDKNFIGKCKETFRRLKHAGTTIILVSHDTDTMKEFCDRGLVLNEGALVFDGSTDDAVNFYERSILHISAEH
jgi:ABC-type polysaccharide/polyol phosphate transport system ATPase subunit